jgi:regulator of cell morphogenesis and NO signaling
MILTEILEVSFLQGKQIQETLFSHFDELEQGAGFIVLHDQDPKLIYQQWQTESLNAFSWEYLQEGPRQWQVSITKRFDLPYTEPIGRIVAKDYRKAEVFNRLGIDYCCAGNKNLREASRDAGLSVEQVISALKNAESVTGSASHDFDKWEPDRLIEYIVSTHHHYIRWNAELIHDQAQKVAELHGENHPELRDLSESIHEFLEKLLNHIEREESLIFPAIRQLIRKKTEPEMEKDFHAASLKKWMSIIQSEHERSDETLRHIRKATYDYLLPPDACNSYDYLFQKLKEFEDNMFKHIHLENNILFPKTEALEQELASI